MTQIGNYNTLKVSKIVDFGLYLDAGDGVEILLPKRYITGKPEVGDEMEVFIYRDSENRLIATTERPYATVGQFAYLKVAAVTSVGAFLQWGIATKDLLVPFREQKVAMKEGGMYFVYVYLDHTTGRIVASAKINKFIGNVFPRYNNGDSVSIIIYDRTEIGYRAIVDNLYYGMLYNDELFKHVEIGQRMNARIKNIREDGKIDLTLNECAEERVRLLASAILGRLKCNGGVLHISDSSAPEMIKGLFQCSKKDFKKAIGALYRERLITIGDSSIMLAMDD